MAPACFRCEVCLTGSGYALDYDEKVLVEKRGLYDDVLEALRVLVSAKKRRTTVNYL